MNSCGNCEKKYKHNQLVECNHYWLCNRRMYKVELKIISEAERMYLDGRRRTARTAKGMFGYICQLALKSYFYDWILVFDLLAMQYTILKNETGSEKISVPA